MPFAHAEEEAEKLRQNLPEVVRRLEEAINEKCVDVNEPLDNILEQSGNQTLEIAEENPKMMDSQMVDLNARTESLFEKQDRDKYIDMVRIMAHAVSKETTDARVALLTFKVVDETIKRAYTKAHMNNLMPSEALLPYIAAPRAAQPFEILLTAPMTPPYEHENKE